RRGADLSEEQAGQADGAAAGRARARGGGRCSPGARPRALARAAGDAGRRAGRAGTTEHARHDVVLAQLVAGPAEDAGTDQRRTAAPPDRRSATPLKEWLRCST